MTVCLCHFSTWEWPRQAVCIAGSEGFLAGKPVLGLGRGRGRAGIGISQP